MHIFERHNPGLIPAILLLAMAVVACRGETTPVVSPPTLSPSPTITTPTLQPIPSPTEAIVIATPPSEAPCLSGGSIEERAQEALANWLGVSSEEIEVIEVEEVEWPDTSLGCPEPGMAYLQVIVPGCRVVMRVGDEVYEYHAGGEQAVVCDREGQSLVWIAPGQPPEAIGSPTPGAQTEEETVTPKGFDNAQFIFIEVREDLVSQGATYPAPFVPPNDLHAYDPTSRTLLVRVDLTVNENLQAIIGKVTTIYLPTRSYSRGALFLFPAEAAASLPADVIELHDDGSVSLAYEGTTFTLLPGEERTFKGSQGETPSSQVTRIVTITNYGLHDKSSIVEFDLTTR